MKLQDVACRRFRRQKNCSFSCDCWLHFFPLVTVLISLSVTVFYPSVGGLFFNGYSCSIGHSNFAVSYGFPSAAIFAVGFSFADVFFFVGCRLSSKKFPASVTVLPLATVFRRLQSRRRAQQFRSRMQQFRSLLYVSATAGARDAIHNRALHTYRVGCVYVVGYRWSASNMSCSSATYSTSGTVEFPP